MGSVEDKSWYTKVPPRVWRRRTDCVGELCVSDFLICGPTGQTKVFPFTTLTRWTRGTEVGGRRLGGGRRVVFGSGSTDLSSLNRPWSSRFTRPFPTRTVSHSLLSQSKRERERLYSKEYQTLLWVIRVNWTPLGRMNDRTGINK